MRWRASLFGDLVGSGRFTVIEVGGEVVEAAGHAPDELVVLSVQ
jgi:hypothetical protein